MSFDQYPHDPCIDTSFIAGNGHADTLAPDNAFLWDADEFFSPEALQLLGYSEAATNDVATDNTAPIEEKPQITGSGTANPAANQAPVSDEPMIEQHIVDITRSPQGQTQTGEIRHRPPARSSRRSEERGMFLLSN